MSARGIIKAWRPPSRAMNVGYAAVMLLVLLTPPALADEPPVAPPARVDYEGGRLTIEARNVPVGVVLVLVGQKLGFEVLDMGAGSAPVEEIWIQDLPLDRALSKLLARTSYAIQYAPDAQKGHRIERIIVMSGGDRETPSPEVAERTPEDVPVPDGEKPPGLTPEQAAKWPELARRIDEVLRNVYGQEPAEPPAYSSTPEEVFSEQQIKTMDVLPYSHLDAPLPVYLPVEPGEAFNEQTLESIEMFRAWEQGQDPLP